MEASLRLEQAADRALAQGRWGPALMMLKQAASPDPELVSDALSPSREAHLLSRALELAWTRLGHAHPDVRLLSERLLDLDPDDQHARARFGVALLLANDDRGLELVDTSLQGLGAHDPDLWGALAEALKRRVEAGATQLQPKVIELYWRGILASPDLPDAYPLLYFIEERAIAEGIPPHRILEADPRDPDLDLGEALRVALRLREQQFAQGHDAPWPAYDLARGRYYLRRMTDPEGPRPRHLLLADLSTAARETLRVARHPQDRHPLAATARTCRRLRRAGIFAPDMLVAEALLLNHHANDALWLAFDDEPLATRSEVEALRAEQARQERLRVLQALHEQEAVLAGLGSRTADLQASLTTGIAELLGQQARLQAHLRSVRGTLAEVDERTLEGLELPAIRARFEPSERRWLAAMARMAGSEAISAALEAAGASPLVIKAATLAFSMAAG